MLRLVQYNPLLGEQHSRIIDQLLTAFKRLRKNLTPFKDRHQDLAAVLLRSRLLLEKLINNDWRGASSYRGGNYEAAVAAFAANASVDGH